MARFVARTNRNFLLLWSGHAISLVGFHGVRIAYPLAVFTVTGSPVAAGWVGFALNVPSLIFQVPAGVAADGANRMRTLMMCQFVGLATTCTAAAVAIAHLRDLWPILAVTAFVEGSVYVFVGLGELSMVRDLVSKELRPQAFSFLEAEQSIAIVMGRAFGAAIYGAARWLPFAANAVSYLLCLGTLSMIPSRSVVPTASVRPAERPTGRSISDGLRIVWADPFLRTSTAMIGGSNIVIQVVLLMILVDLKDSGRPAWTIGVVLGAAGVGGTLGATAATRLTRYFPSQRVYQGALWCWTALLIPTTLSDDPFVLAACWGGIGGVGVVSNVALTMYRVDVIPEHVLGRAMATIYFVCYGAAAFGALSAGYLLSFLGVAATWWAVLSSMVTLAVCGSIRPAHSSAGTPLHSR